MAQVLVIGNGAREHALAQQLLASSQVTQVFVAPGNPGMTETGITVVPIAVTDIASLVTFAQQKAIDLTVVGMEDALMAGVVDAFNTAKLKIFGPNKAAAILEGSKSFTKELLSNAAIPTAQYQVVTDLATAQAYIATQTFPLVFKLDGLAFGKGVTIIKSQQVAQTYLTKLYQNNPTAKLVIEEYLTGEEFSLFTLVGEKQLITLPLAQDHKRLLDNDLGPNTGGMGAYSPLPQFDDIIKQVAIDEIVKPTLAAMQALGRPFTGVLYTGVMQTSTGPKVIEFNVRFGDPEAQVLLPQLEGDLYELLNKLVTGEPVVAKWQTDKYYLGVVLAAQGYPQNSVSGDLLPTLSNSGLTQVNYASVTKTDAGFVTAGGRVATLVTAANTITAAQEQIYQILAASQTQLQYRHDIGNKALTKN
ncbi:phosphoribosylamine--glycine ligase [Weissella beninensis]|uniref:Phosphoribosylamine--glycine ligase n=1 Tax=Periweissella beninensis TaxID=504936 RepID=A0ABT0VGL4_9LACO|nr:phosphoribosylamine--glycine ligase [Periweissella beninensis]MBM7543859.1 phosphoribosylamine--glycine ligase [Periweissella beninensis]MCM2436760.1 phosphoribosylamine--glycine ligase [Periweissella beninensis]